MKTSKILGFAVGPVAGALIGLMTVPIISWSFDPADIGRMTVLQVVLSLSSLLFVLGLDQAYVREYHCCSSPKNLLKTCFAPGFLVVMIFAFATLIFSRDMAKMLYGIENSKLYVVTVACILLSFISRFLSLILRMQERGLAYSIIQVTPRIVNLAIIVLVILAGVDRDFVVLITASMLSVLVMVLIYAWNTRLQWIPAISEKISFNEMRPLLNFGFPLVFSGMAYWGLTSTSTLILRSQSTLEELGIYAVAGSFAAAASIFQSIFSIVWAPTVYKWEAQGVDMARIDVIARQALSVVCAIFVLVGTFSWFTDYLLPAHYTSIKYLLLCSIAPPLLYTLSEITSVGIGISRRSMLAVWTTLFAFFINIMFSLWLAPKYGAAGAVTANAISYVIYFIARTEASALVWRQLSRVKIYVFVVFLNISGVATVVFASSAKFHYSLAWLIIAAIIFLSFRKEYAELIVVFRDVLVIRKRLIDRS